MSDRRKAWLVSSSASSMTWSSPGLFCSWKGMGLMLPSLTSYSPSTTATMRVSRQTAGPLGCSQKEKVMEKTPESGRAPSSCSSPR